MRKLPGQLRFEISLVIGSLLIGASACPAWTRHPIEAALSLATASGLRALQRRFSPGRPFAVSNPDFRRYAFIGHSPRFCPTNQKPPNLTFLVFTLFHYFCKKVTLEHKKEDSEAQILE
jgi:hypothetical protein